MEKTDNAKITKIFDFYYSGTYRDRESYKVTYSFGSLGLVISND
ncbi:hypothetical protein LEP1GSC080_0650 [Leptospira interrogans str. FPW2026]|nr:hypothetical protein LEP1GSC080_0650 [Leptospira interrogans str. FPW2026]